MSPVIIIFLIRSCVFSSSVKNPIVLIPGLAGNQMEARMSTEAKINPKCLTTTENYSTLWFNPIYAITHSLECIGKAVILMYDNTTRETYNIPGIQTQIPGFGQTNTVEYLDSTRKIAPYFSLFVERMVKEGYTPGFSIHAAPYDFRKAPNELTDYFENLTKLIESTYEKNENKKVILVAHSLGGPLSLAFLHRRSQSWKDKYIKFEISLSSPWAGDLRAMETFIKGLTLQGITAHRITDSPVISNQLNKLSVLIDPLPSLITLISNKVVASFPSVVWQFPTLNAWNKTDVLVQTENKNYTLQNMEEFFKDFNQFERWEVYKNLQQDANNLTEPGVELYCLYGTGIQTVSSVYSSGSLWDDVFKNSTYENGDGGVKLQSLEACKKWIGGSRTTIAKPFWGVHHVNFVEDPVIINYMVDLIFNHN